MILLAIIATAVAQDFSGETPRVWTVEGRKVNATLTGYQNRQVTLKSEAGTVKSFPTDKIGATDRAYLKKKLDPTQVESLDSVGAAEVGRILRESVVTAPMTTSLRGTVTADKVIGHSPDGSQVLSWSHRNRAILWDRTNGEIVTEFSGCAGGNETLMVSPRGTTYAAAHGASEAALFDAATNEPLLILEGHTKPVKVVAFNDDGSLLATGSDDGNVILWETDSGKLLQRLEGHTARITAIAFHPRGETVLSGSADDTARLWNIKSGKEMRKLDSRDIGGPVTMVAFPDDGNVAAIVSVGKVILWATPQVDPKNRATLSSSDSGGSGSGGNQMPKTVLGMEQKVVVIAPQQQIVPPEATFDSMAFGHQGVYLLLGTKAGTAICSNVVERLHIRKVERLGGGVVRVGFGDVHYATGSFDDSTIVWDAATGENFATFVGHSYGVTPIVFAGNGRLTLTSGGWNDTSICLRETATGKLLQRFVGHPGPVLSMKLSSDGQRLFSISADRDTPPLAGVARTKSLTKTLILWDTVTGKKLCEQSGLDVAAVSDSGKIILSSRAGTVTFWNAATGASINSGRWDGVGTNWFLDTSGARLFATGASATRTNDKGETTTVKGLMVRNTRSGDVIGSPLKLRYDPILTTWSPDGRRVFTTFSTKVPNEPAHQAELWGTQSGERPIAVFPYAAAISAVAVHDATTFLVGSTDGTALLLRLEEKEDTDDEGRISKSQVFTVTKTFTNKAAVAGVGFAEDGKIALVGCEDGTLTAHTIQ